MSGVEFITAFKLGRFELRLVGYEVIVSPSSLLELDEELCTVFELHHEHFRRILDGFHLLPNDKVCIRLITILLLCIITCRINVFI